MKKLTNISPFLLLLFPVFIMMILASAAKNTNNQDEEMAMKPASSKEITIKVSGVFPK